MSECLSPLTPLSHLEHAMRDSVTANTGTHIGTDEPNWCLRGPNLSGSPSRNPFLTPTQLTPQCAIAPPHLTCRRQVEYHSQADNVRDETSSSPESVSPPMRRAKRGKAKSRHSWRERSPSSELDAGPRIRHETMAGVPPWPPKLKLSLNTGNWLEWSRRLTTSLAMGQLDRYPLGLTMCPSTVTNRMSHQNWCSNDCMILGFMQTHMFSLEIQHIAHCLTSEHAF